MSWKLSYSTLDVVMGLVAAGSGGICTRQRMRYPPFNSTHPYIHYLEIKPAGAGDNRPVALIVAGVHAHELAPPPAVLTFAGLAVLNYASGDVVYPAFTDPDGSVPYGRWTVPNKDVRRVVDAMTILVVPVVNPAGRDQVLAGDPTWRGNRNLAACHIDGVDINRNFPIGWDVDRYYEVGDASIADLTQTCTTAGTFRGPIAGGENETANIMELIDKRDVRCFIDVHSWGRRVLLPWGLALNQENDPTQSFTNTDWDNVPGSTHPGRDAVFGGYKEFVPNARPDRLRSTQWHLGEQMRQAILDQAGPNKTARRRSTYKVYQSNRLYQEQLSLSHIVPIPATSTDYAFARQFKAGEPGPAFACALECGWLPGGGLGTDPSDEGGFFPPNATKYQKIEREVHAALWALLRGFASTLSKRGP